MLNLTFNNSEDFKKYINNNNEKDFTLDVTSMNIFDSLKFMVMSSAYFYQKYPNYKLKCKINSNDIKYLLSSFEIKNLEFV